jgi:hypothetical protein
MKWQERILSNLLKALFSICIHYPLCQRCTLWNVISCFLHRCTLSNVISCCSKVKHEITFNRINLKVVVSILVVDSPGFVCFTDFDFFPIFCIIFVTLDSILGDRYFVVTSFSRFKFKNCKPSHQTTLKFCIFKIKSAEI